MLQNFAGMMIDIGHPSSKSSRCRRLAELDTLQVLLLTRDYPYATRMLENDPCMITGYYRQVYGWLCPSIEPIKNETSCQRNVDPCKAERMTLVLSPFGLFLSPILPWIHLQHPSKEMMQSIFEPSV